MRIGSVPAFFSPIFLNRALIEMCFYDSYPVFWEHSDLENPLQHQTSTTLLWLLRENPSTLPLSCSRCCVSTSTPKPRAEGSSPSAPATKPAKTLGFCRFSFCMCCMVMWFALVQTPGFLIWFDPFSTVPIPSSTQNAPGFAFFWPKPGAFPCFCPLLTCKIFGIFFVHYADRLHRLKSLVIPLSRDVSFLT